MNKSLSVIIPAYQAEKYLKEAVDSVRSQNWPGPLEILVIDDGSTDTTAQVARSLDVTLLQKQQGGASSARNLGLSQASGNLILLLDADDLLSEGALDALHRALEENCTDAVFALTQDFVSPELTDAQKAELRPQPAPYPGSLVGCAMFRSRVFRQVGVFNETLRSGETVDWMMRFREAKLPSVQLPFVAQKRRLHLTNTGRLHRQQEMANYAALLRARMKKN